MAQDLEARIRQLEEVEALRRLKYFYCTCADRGIAGDASAMDELIERFTDDVRGEYTNLGVYEGKAEMSKFFREVVPDLLSYSLHMVHNPTIDVDGDTATGVWYLDVPCILRKEQKSAWIGGRYEERYIKVGGQWMWKEIKAVLEWLSPFDVHWSQSKRLEKAL